MKVIALLVAVLLTGCGTTVIASPTPAETNAPDSQTEVLQSYVDHIGEFTAINQSIQTSIADMDLEGVQSACERLSAFGSSGLALQDFGIDEVDLHWDKAMRDYEEAGQECAEGAATGDTKQIDRASALLRDAADEIAKATAAIPT